MKYRCYLSSFTKVQLRHKFSFQEKGVDLKPSPCKASKEVMWQ